VTDVSNQIGIKPRPDAGNMMANIVSALNRSWVSPAHIDVAPTDGRLTLTGTVETWPSGRLQVHPPGPRLA